MLASSCREFGLSPADLRLKVDGRFVAVRLREGESIDALANQVSAYHGPSPLGLGGVDSLIDALRTVLALDIEEPVIVGCDQRSIRALVQGNGAIFRIALVDLWQGSPSPALFVCSCHPMQVAESEPLVANALPEATTALSVRCPEALLSGLRVVLMSARGAHPAWVWVDRATIKGQARDAMILAGVQLGTADPGSDLSRKLDQASPRQWPDMSDEFLGWSHRAAAIAFAVNLPRLNAGTTRSSGQLPAWTGMPIPPACRAVTRRVLAAIDEAVHLPPEKVADIAASAQCAYHPHGDLEGLFGHHEWVVQNEEGRVRLTSAGQKQVDTLNAHNANFQFSELARHKHGIRTWQRKALYSWARHGRFGVVEAVTGTGKTRVGVEAAAEALTDGLKVVVCVPSLVLLEQWHRELTSAIHGRVGRVGGGSYDVFVNHDVLVGTVQTLRNSAKLLKANERGYMLIVDECHRVGAPTFQSALDSRYVRRLGLTATFERSDDRLKDLEAFFESSPVFRIGYEDAVPQAIVAHYVVALVGVDFGPVERREYDDADYACRDSRGRLVRAGLPAEPFGTFMEAVATLAKEDTGLLGNEARRYMDAFSRRAEVLSLAQGKVEAVRVLAPVAATGGGCLLFTMRVAGAVRAAAVLREEGVSAVAIHGGSSAVERESALASLRVGKLAAIAAPRILDEGVDVPEADMAVIIATSSKRLQMIQRMGRVLRLKKDGGRARFVLLYVRDTAEDPRGEGGAHEAFFDSILPTADDVADFDLARGDELCDFLRRAQDPPTAKPA
jgi:superfamily II DNA or RNA helicase